MSSPVRPKRTVFPTSEIHPREIKLEVKLPEEYAREKEEMRIANQKTQACIERAVERFKELIIKGKKVD
jgi:hypothetical protein